MSFLWKGWLCQNGLIPIHLSRESCSPEAEQLVRQLGACPGYQIRGCRFAYLARSSSWRIIRPRRATSWGIPQCFTLRVLISPEQYQKTRRELVQRFGTNPIAAANQMEALHPPKFSDLGIEGTFEWLLDHFPYDSAEITRFQQFIATLKEKKGALDFADFNGIQRNLGVALQHMVSGGRVLCYNAKEASRQDVFPLALLERHNVYPLYNGRHVVYLLSETADCYAFEDEWLSLGNQSVQNNPRSRGWWGDP